MPTFGKLLPITVTQGATPQLAVVKMPGGYDIHLSIEEPSDGSGALLMIRGPDRIEIWPAVSNTIGVRNTLTG